MAPKEGNTSADVDIDIIYERRPGAFWASERFSTIPGGLKYFDGQMDADFYAHPHGKDAQSYHYLNNASLPNPVEAVREEARKTFEAWVRGELSTERKEEILHDARTKAAALLHTDERNIALCRNTSEAVAFYIALSGLMHCHWEERSVLTTDAENPSIHREIFAICDNGSNPHDPIATHSSWNTKRPKQYESPKARATKARWYLSGVQRYDDEQVLHNVEESIALYQPIVFIISHVLRTTGRVLPIEAMIARAREAKRKYCPQDPDVFVCVDGAQALGAVDIDFSNMDADMYVSSGHKLLQGEAVGILAFNRNNPRLMEGLKRLQTIDTSDRVILDGMFHKDLGIKANVPDEVSYPDLAGFSKAVTSLQEKGLMNGVDITAFNAHRAALKARCLAGLRDIAASKNVPIEILDETSSTTAILAFRIGPDPHSTIPGELVFEPGAIPTNDYPRVVTSPEKVIAEELDRRGVGISFLRRGKIFRVSFGPENTPEDIDAFLREFSDIVTAK